MARMLRTNNALVNVVAILVLAGCIGVVMNVVSTTEHRGSGTIFEGWSQGAPVDQTLDIAEMYMRILDRRPSESELASTKRRFRIDPAFSLAILEHQLNLGPERRRRVDTQTNALKSELEGIYSRQQVRMHIRAVHHDHVGTTPSAETEYYLFKKFVDSGLDEHKLLELVKAISIVPIAGNPLP